MTKLAKGSCFREGYAVEIDDTESELIKARWTAAGIEDQRQHEPRSKNSIGLALSGGGIRSATFCLGILQALAKSNQLRQVDFLSTVSGGGYIGSFLGRLYTREGANADNVAETVANPYSKELRWLREHGRYVTPTGGGDILTAAGHVLRSWIALHFNLLPLILGLFCLLGVARGALWDIEEQFFANSVHMGVWWSPWIVLPAVFAILFPIPLGTAFWLSQALERMRKRNVLFAFAIAAALLYAAKLTPDIVVPIVNIHLARILEVVAVCVVLAPDWGDQGPKVLAMVCTLLVVSWFVKDPGTAAWISRIVGVIAFMSIVWSILINRIARKQLSKIAPEGSAVQGFSMLAKTRNLLTDYLGVTLLWFGVLVAIALIDTLGQVSYVWYQLSKNKPVVIATIGGFFAAISAVHGFADKLLRKDKDTTENRSWSAALLPIAAGILATVYLTAPACAAQMVLWRNKFPEHIIEKAFPASPSVYLSANNYVTVGDKTPNKPKAGRSNWWWPLISAGICSIIIWTLRRNLAFLNLSSYHALYSARLARAYLGASNPARHNRPEGLHISDPIPGDDCGMHDYRPHAKGGPLHLINVTINETVSGESQVQQRDRKGLPMIIGPNTINVGVRHLARANYEAKITEVSPLQHGGFHVFGRGPKSVQQLRLSDWVGISGAAFSTGAGAHTSLALSILTGIANVRLGYWWDSRVRPKDRSPEITSSRRAEIGQRSLAEIFPLATHLIHEFTGRFHGPASQRWYLSDGGHFENTGCYELIRRRAPLIFICDCGADPEYRFEDLSNLVRKARIDYDTDIEFCDAEALKKIFDMLDESASGAAAFPRELFGNLQKLFRQASPQSAGFPGGLYSGCHAAIAKVRYDISVENESRRDFDSLIFVIKPSLTGDEPLDLLQYQFKNPAFPQEPTSDQFFDEAQWESYRRLGLHIGEKLFDSVALVQLLNGILAQTGGEGSSSKT